MTFTYIEGEALAVLRKTGPRTCGELGAALWGKGGLLGHSENAKATKYCRPAGGVLRRLLAKRAVRQVHTKHHTLWEAII